MNNKTRYTRGSNKQWKIVVTNYFSEKRIGLEIEYEMRRARQIRSQVLKRMIIVETRSFHSITKVYLDIGRFYFFFFQLQHVYIYISVKQLDSLYTRALFPYKTNKKNKNCYWKTSECKLNCR